MEKELMEFFEEKNKEFEDLSDAMWFNMMQESVSEYNEANKADFNEYDSVMEYVEMTFGPQY